MMKLVSLKLFLYLSAIIMVFIMVRLGFWQLSRAEEKQTIQNYLVNQQEQQVDLGITSIDDTFLFQQGVGSGEFIPEKAILIDNQVSEGRVGYHVVAPFRFSPNQNIVLVNLGWVSAGASRQIKPDIVLPQGQLSITGRLQKTHAEPPIWQDKSLLIQNGVWQFLPVREYQKEMNIQTASLLLELDESAENSGNYVRQWREYDDTWINRHKAYALQWFSLAVAFILMCLVVEFRSRRKPS